MTTKTYLTGYRGTKAHAVDPSTPRNQAMLREGGTEAVSLCGWGVQTGDVKFTNLPGLSCKACARKAARGE